MTATIEHEPFCLPRPGESEPRIESFPVTRYGSDGYPTGSRATVTRCQECGAQTLVG